MTAPVPNAASGPRIAAAAAVPPGRFERLLRLSCLHSSTFLYEQDRELRYTWAQNPPAPFALKDIIGSCDADLFPPEAAAAVTAFKRAVLSTGEGGRREFSAMIGGETRWFDISVEAVPDENGAVAAIAGALLETTERRRSEEVLRSLHAELKQRREELAELSAGLVTAHEEQRRQIAHDLHDDLNQRLAVMEIRVHTLHDRIPQTQPDIRDELRQLRDCVAELNNAVRQIAHQLHPAVLDHLGLEAALYSFCTEFSARENIRVSFQRQKLPDEIPRNVALCLYRIAQEALRNVARHSGAKEAAVSLRASGRTMRLSISDNGRGFDPDARKGFPALGIRGMQERARLIGGEFRLCSSTGEGTQVEVQVTVPEVQA